MKRLVLVESGLIASIDPSTNADLGFFDVAADTVQFDQKTYAVPLAVKSLVLYTNDALISAPPKETEDLFHLANDLPEDVVLYLRGNRRVFSHAGWIWRWIL